MSAIIVLAKKRTELCQKQSALVMPFTEQVMDRQDHAMAKMLVGGDAVER